MQINWKDKLIDLLVVIVGISIAFYLNNLQTDRNDMKVKRQHLLSIQAELERDTTEAGKNIRAMERLDSLLGKLLFSLDSADLSRKDFTMRFQGMMRGATYTFHDNAYKSFMSSGRFDVISDLGLQNALTDYYMGQYGQIRIIDDITFENLKTNTIPLVSERIDMLRMIKFGEIGEDHQKIMKDVKFRNHCFVTKELQRQQLESYREAYQAAGKLMKMIESKI